MKNEIKTSQVKPDEWAATVFENGMPVLTRCAGTERNARLDAAQAYRDHLHSNFGKKK